MAAGNAYKLGIVISADASSVKPAAAETKNELVGIGQAATVTETKMQRLIATATGLHSGAANSNQRAWLGALADEGMALDQLRSKYNPMFAVIQNYRNAKAEIRTANAMGALSVNEMTKALERERQAALASIDVIKGRASAMKSASGQNFAATNTMFQLQDIGVTAAMGMNPAMIAMQQGTQIAGGMAGMNLKQAGTTLAGAFTQLLSPVSFATVAVTGLTAAAIQYAMKWTGTAKNLSETIEQHETQIKSLQEAYRYAGTGAEAYLQRINAGTRFQAAGSRKELEKALTTGSGTALGQLGGLSSGSIFGDAFSPAGEKDEWTVRARYQQFETAILHLQKTAKDGKPDLLGFRQLVEERWSLNKNDESLKKLAKELLDLEPSAVAAAIALERLEKIRADNAERAARRREAGYADGISGMRGIAALQNSDRRQVEEDFAKARGNAGDRDERADATRQRSEALARINAEEQRQIELARIDIQLQVARDPITQAELAAARERIELSRKNIDATEAEILVKRARDKVMAETFAQNAAELTDLKADLDARRKVNEAVAAGNINAAQAAEYLQLEARLRPLIVAAAKAEGEEKQKLLEIIREQTAASQALFEENKRAQALDYIKSQNDRIAGLKVELALVGETETTRSRVMAQFEAEQKVRELGLSANSTEADQIRTKARLQQELTQEIEKQADAWATIRSAGENAIDSLIDKLSEGDLSGALDDIAKDFAKTALQLSMSNPLKNSIFGTNYGTINDVGGFGGIISKLFGGGQVDADGIIKSALGASTTTGAMNVQAAVVNIGGAGIGGLDVSRMFNPANSNVAGGSMAQFATAIRNIESRGSGGYSAMGPITANGDRAYGAYQVMGANIPAWTKSALGSSLSPQQFLASQEAQDAVFNKIFGGYVGKYGASGAAQAWFAGPGSIGRGGNASDMLGTSITQYVGKFESEVQKLTGVAGQATGSIGNLGSGLNVASQGLEQFGGGLQGLLRNLSGMGAGGFNIGSFASGLGSIQSPQVWGAIASGIGGLWSSGGYTGPGGVDEPRGIVHAGEVVWSQRDVARAGGPAVVDAMRLGRRGYSGGGVVDGEHVYRAAPSGYYSAASAPAPQQQPAQINIHNYAGVNVREEDESDGRGGRRTNIVLEESVGDALSRPGSSARGTLGRSYGLRPKMIKR